MKKLKVMTVVGTRPEIIRLSRVMVNLDRSCDHTIVHTGQNYDYELNQIFFEDLELRRPDHFLEAAGATSSETIANVIARVDSVLASVNPDAVLILGDTNSCMSAIPAKRRRIPVFHMEAGNRCFDQRVPEEINRRIVDHVADVNLTYSSIAREYLLREGLPPQTTIKTGSPMKEVLLHYWSKIRESDVLSRLHLEAHGFFLVSMHREENVDSQDGIGAVANALNRIGEKFQLPIIVSTHPRTRKRIESAGLRFHEAVRLLKPLSFSDYNKLQLDSLAVLSDSGTISEESAILGFPALNLREAHERPEAMEEGVVMMVGLNVERILQGLKIACTYERRQPFDCPVCDYDVDNVSEKVVKMIHSYTDYVNSNVWRQAST